MYVWEGQKEPQIVAGSGIVTLKGGGSGKGGRGERSVLGGWACGRMLKVCFGTLR